MKLSHLSLVGIGVVLISSSAFAKIDYIPGVLQLDSATSDPSCAQKMSVNPRPYTDSDGVALEAVEFSFMSADSEKDDSVVLGEISGALETTSASCNSIFDGCGQTGTESGNQLKVVDYKYGFLGRKTFRTATYTLEESDGKPSAITFRNKVEGQSPQLCTYLY